MHAHCTGKERYASKIAALKRIAGQIEKHRFVKRCSWGKRQMQVYRCPSCGYWHVGGTVPAKRPRLANELDDAVLGILPAGKLAKLGRG